MHIAHKLHAAVDAAIAASANEEDRYHLGASLLGQECSRRIWYQWRWTHREKFVPRMLRLFNRGHETEPRFVHWLRAAGVEVWEAGESGEHKAMFRISDHDGHFGGTPDGVGRNIPDLSDPMEPALLEFKTHNDKSFKSLIANGIMSTKWQHFVQMQIYMHYHRLRWALYCAINKNDDDTRYELVQYDQEQAERAIERAGAIIWSTEPPARIGKNPAHYGCKYCHFQRLCYFGDVEPNRNCRSCQWSAPIPGGLWTCKLRSLNLDEKAQRAGCERYQVNPQLHQPNA